MKITPEMKEALWALWDASYKESDKPRVIRECLFCGGEYTCRCGMCWEGDYHDSDCIAYMAFALAMSDPEDEFEVKWDVR